MPRESSFEAYRPTTLPASIGGPFARLLTSTLGRMQDEELDLLEVAVKARLPRYCPDDGLDKLGAAFQLPRFPGEAHAAYRGRLQAAWTTWEEAGAATSIEGQIRGYGVTDVRCYPNDELGDAYEYSAFVVKLGPDFGTTGIGEQLWGDFTWGGDTTWGSTATPAQRNALCRMVLRWKAAHGLPVKVVLDFGEAFIWGFSTWGDASTWGESSPCEWYLANIWGESMVWGESTWGTGRWFAPGMGF